MLAKRNPDTVFGYRNMDEKEERRSHVEGIIS